MGLEAAAEVEIPEKEQARGDVFLLWLLAVGHAVTDTYGHSLLAPLYPDLKARLGLSLEQVAGLPVLLGLSASLAQPLLGWVSDRRPRWCLVALGPVLAALFIGFVGHAQAYWQLGLLLFLAGTGIGAFHPQGAALAKRAGGDRSLAMSVFTVGGNVGFGLAPLLGALYAAVFGMERFYLASLPALVFAAVMLTHFHGSQSLHLAGSRVGRHGERNLPALAALTATVVVRSAVQIGMTTFLPFLVQAQFPPSQQGAMKAIGVSAFLLASALSGPLGGHLSDRFGRKTVMVWSFLLAPWPMLLAFTSPGIGMVALLAVGAFLLMLPHPGNVVLAQELLPDRPGIAASMITGLAWGVALLLALPLGAAAERIGVMPALQALCLVPLLGVPLVAAIPGRR